MDHRKKGVMNASNLIETLQLVKTKVNSDIEIFNFKNG